MPSTHYRQDNLQRLGPVIRLQITPVSDLLEKLDVLGEPAPPPSEATALVDTGSEATAVDRKIIQDLGLEPTGFASVRTPGRLYQACRQYSLRLVFDKGIEVEAAALELDFGWDGMCLLYARLPTTGLTIHTLYRFKAMALYFAYGSNMLSKQMEQRCPGAKAVATGLLRSWSGRRPWRGVGANRRAPARARRLRRRAGLVPPPDGGRGAARTRRSCVFNLH